MGDGGRKGEMEGDEGRRKEGRANKMPPFLVMKKNIISREPAATRTRERGKQGKGCSAGRICTVLPVAT